MYVFICMMVFVLEGFAQDKMVTRTTNWPPIYYQDASGNWTGLDVELIKAVFEKAGIQYAFKDLPWARGLKNMENGNTHFMMNLSKTEERAVYMHFIGPVRQTSGMGLITKKGNETWATKTLDDLVKIAKEKGKRFGYQRGAFYSKDFNDRIENDTEFKKHFEIISKATLNVKKTLKGRILGFFESPLVMKYRIKNEKNYFGLTVHQFKFKQEGSDVYFGASKKGVDPDTLSKFKSAFDKCKSEGTLDKIVDEWEKIF